MLCIINNFGNDNLYAKIEELCKPIATRFPDKVMYCRHGLIARENKPTIKWPQGTKSAIRLIIQPQRGYSPGEPHYPLISAQKSDDIYTKYTFSCEGACASSGLTIILTINLGYNQTVSEIDLHLDNMTGISEFINKYSGQLLVTSNKLRQRSLTKHVVTVINALFSTNPCADIEYLIESNVLQRIL